MSVGKVMHMQSLLDGSHFAAPRIKLNFTYTVHVQDVKQADSLGACLQQQATYQSAFSIVLAAQQLCTEVGEALIMIFVGMIAPDGVGVNSSQALLR